MRVLIEQSTSQADSEGHIAALLRGLGCDVEWPGGRSGEGAVVLHDLRGALADTAGVVARIERDPRPTLLVASDARPELAELAARAPHVVLVTASGDPTTGLAVALRLCAARSAVVN